MNKLYIAFAFILVCISIYYYTRRNIYEHFTDIGEYIDIVYYINLDHRIDRNENILNELSSIDFPKNKIKRISAVYNKDHGGIGCSHSHIKILKEFINSNYKNCLILEDDFEFTVDKTTVNDLFSQLQSNGILYDVLLVSSNTHKSAYTNYDFLHRLYNASTTSGYIVTKEYAPILLQNFIEGVELFETSIKNKENKYHLYALDRYWNRLQEKDHWYVFNPKLGNQMESYSDIEKTVVNYKV